MPNAAGLTGTAYLCANTIGVYNTGGKFTLYQPIILNRKFTAEYIFTGQELLSFPSAIITSASGTIIDLVPLEDAGEGIEVMKGLLCPGFVNAHCHLELSHLKGIIPENTGLVEFVQLVMSKRAADAELKVGAMQQALNELYQSGTVLVGDICNTTDTLAIKKESLLRWHNFIEVSGFTDTAAASRMKAVNAVRDQFLLQNNHWPVTVCPHAPYSVSNALFQLLNHQSANQVITIHNQECAAENELYQAGTGKFRELYRNFAINDSAFQPTGTSSFQSWLPFFNQQQTMIAVHNTFINGKDLSFAAQQGIQPNLWHCLCVNANRYIEQAFPPLELLLLHTDNIVVGTDSYASNHQLNILEELKTIQRYAGNSVSLPMMLKWATYNGALALQQAATLGSFSKGKMPGIVLVEHLDGVKLSPLSVATRIL